MRLGVDRLKDLTLLSAAGYIFLFALTVKGVFLYVSQHPPKEALLSVEGIVRETTLGGQGEATSFQLETDSGTHRYLSYFGKLWPGMERIRQGDHVQVLAERSRLNRGELITGKQYYIWELIHDNRVVVSYEDVREQVEETEATANRYADVFLALSLIFLLIAYIRKVSIFSAMETR